MGCTFHDASKSAKSALLTYWSASTCRDDGDNYGNYAEFKRFSDMGHDSWNHIDDYLGALIYTYHQKNVGMLLDSW